MVEPVPADGVVRLEGHQFLCQRRSTMALPQSELQVADLTLNVHTREVSRGGKSILLQALEFSLLEYLMRNAGRTVSKTMIMENVWDYNFNPGTNVVESIIATRRSKGRFADFDDFIGKVEIGVLNSWVMLLMKSTRSCEKRRWRMIVRTV